MLHLSKKYWKGIIPIYINNFNRLTSTKQLASYFDHIDGTSVVIIDNASSYEPLLEWYSKCPYKVIKLKQNYGHLAPWSQGCYLDKIYNSDYYVVTDADLDLSHCPKDLMKVLIRGIKEYKVNKVGLSLEISDLPDDFPLKNDVINWEKKYWQTMTPDKKFYKADVDTTFALYDTTTPQKVATQIDPSLRTARPYTAKHIPWYLTPNTLSEEEKYIIKNSKDGETHWTKQLKKML